MRKICSLKKKNEKKGFGKTIGSDTDTEIGPWFPFPIPKPGFGHTLTDYENENVLTEIFLSHYALYYLSL